MKNYLITGATSGVGEACAKMLASEENRLVIVGRNEEKLEELKESLPGSIEPVRYDLNNLQDIEKIFKICQIKSFKLDGMIYCAGLDAFRPIKVIDEGEMHELMNVNCFSFVKMCRFYYSKRYSNDNTVIIAISSLASKLCETGMVSYAMSKAALNAAVKTASKEFIKRGIRVNAILPGGIASRMGNKKAEVLNDIFQAQKNSGESRGENSQQLGDISCEEVAEFSKYLLSSRSRCFTGELFTMSGGRVHGY